MDAIVVDCFRKSATEVLASELGCPVTVGEPSVLADEYVTRGVTAVLGVTGRLKGLAVIGLSRESALGVISQIVGQQFSEIDEIVRSGIAELGNVVVGSSVTALAEIGYQCGITPPAIVIGEGSVIAIPNLSRTSVPVSTPAGAIEMQLMLRENGAH